MLARRLRPAPAHDGEAVRPVKESMGEPPCTVIAHNETTEPRRPRARYQALTDSALAKQPSGLCGAD
ncbi:unnamed protein product [Lota lota]